MEVVGDDDDDDDDDDGGGGGGGGDGDRSKCMEKYRFRQLYQFPQSANIMKPLTVGRERKGKLFLRGQILFYFLKLKWIKKIFFQLNFLFIALFCFIHHYLLCCFTNILTVFRRGQKWEKKNLPIYK